MLLLLWIDLVMRMFFIDGGYIMFVGWNWMNFMFSRVDLVCSVSVWLLLVYFYELEVILNDLLMLLVVRMMAGVLKTMKWLDLC